MENWRRKVYIVCLAQFLTNVGFTIVLPFLPLYIQNLPVGTTGNPTLWIGFTLAAQPLTMIVASPIWGLVADRFGRKLMLLRATLLGGLVMFSMSFVQTVEQLFLLRLVQGLTTGVVSASSAYVSANVPRRHVGEALGWVATARWIGIASGPLIGGVLSDLVGIRTSFWFNGTFMLGAGLLILFWLPEKWEYVPTPGRGPLLRGFGFLFQGSNVKYLYLFVFLVHIPMSFTLPVASLYVRELSAASDHLLVPAATATGLMFGLFAATGAVSSVKVGKLCDRYGPKLILILSAGASCLVFLPQAFVGQVWQLLALQALAGVAVGGIFPSMAALLSKVSAGSHQGAIFGVENSVRSVARVIAPVAGSALALRFGLSTAYLAASGAFLCLVLLALLILGWGEEKPIPN